MDSYKLRTNLKVRKKDLPSIPAKQRQRIITTIGKLTQNPKSLQSKKLTARDEYRLRLGSYRILYTINHQTRTITVIKVAHRKEVYK